MFFFFFPDALYQKVTFAVASVAESLQPPWVLLVPARSPVALHSVRDERTERIRSFHTLSPPSPKHEWSWHVRVAGWC